MQHLSNSMSCAVALQSGHRLHKAGRFARLWFDSVLQAVARM